MSNENLEKAALYFTNAGKKSEKNLRRRIQPPQVSASNDWEDDYNAWITPPSNFQLSALEQSTCLTQQNAFNNHSSNTSHPLAANNNRQRPAPPANSYQPSENKRTSPSFSKRTFSNSRRISSSNYQFQPPPSDKRRQTESQNETKPSFSNHNSPTFVAANNNERYVQEQQSAQDAYSSTLMQPQSQPIPSGYTTLPIMPVSMGGAPGALSPTSYGAPPNLLVSSSSMVMINSTVDSGGIVNGNFAPPTYVSTALATTNTVSNSVAFAAISGPDLEAIASANERLAGSFRAMNAAMQVLLERMHDQQADLDQQARDIQRLKLALSVSEQLRNKNNNFDNGHSSEI